MYLQQSITYMRQKPDRTEKIDKSTIKVNFNTPLLVEQVNRNSVRI